MKSTHFTLGSTLSLDPTNDTIKPTLSDRGQLREKIELDYGGDEYFGTFTIDDYDLSGCLFVHLQGTVHATRITVRTDLKDLF